jgi:3-deoxy-D-manno-octulosonic-acid transferase
MGFRETGYELLMRSAPALLRVAAPFHAKLARGLAGRARTLEQLRHWAAARRNVRQPLIWLHAPSVGESLMAQAIVDSLRAQQPDLQFAFTHFSPSAEALRERVGADVSAYLPWDDRASMRQALGVLQPDLIAFVRSEIWPTLVEQARLRGRPALLVNAVLSAGSRRLAPLARVTLRPAYQHVCAVGAIDAAAAHRFQRLGVSPERVTVTGDARFDQVWQRVQRLDREQPLLARLRDTSVTTIVAGSTWPADEAHLLPVLQRFTACRWILAPHEPTGPHLQKLEKKLVHQGVPHARLADIEARAGAMPGVIIVDRVGVLADLYALADLAYVGGAFDKSGVHSVVEPAALGVPVIMGPQHGNAAEAQELIDAGGALSVNDMPALTRAFESILASRERLLHMGSAARSFVRGKLGGAQRNAQLILQWLEYGAR